MERMEVEQCAGAGGGLSLRRSNSAPMLPSLSESAMTFQVCGNRCRRSSVSVNLNCPGLGPPSGLAWTQLRSTFQSRADPLALEMSPSWYSTFHLSPCLHSNGGIPNSSPIPAPRFDRMGASLELPLPALTSLKRKGSAEVDSPPNKLFVAGVPEHASLDLPVLDSPESG